MIVTPLEIIVKDGVTTTTGALKMMETDPHGITLSIVAISVVFSCLLILFCVYSLMGAIFTGKFKKAKSAGANSPAEANPLTSQNRNGGKQPAGAPDEVAAAIAMALHLYLGGNHDVESGFITIDNQSRSAWADKGRGFRKIPVRQ